MSNQIKSIIRTIVPVLVGLLISTAARAGIDLPETELTTLLDAALIGAYYSLIRWLEERFPWVGWFLGLPSRPAYGGVSDNGGVHWPAKQQEEE